MNLYVGNLSKNLDAASVRLVFSKFGNCRLSHFTSFAFVEYEDRKDAEQAIKCLNGCDIDGKVIKVEWAKVPSTALKCFKCNQDGHTSANHKPKKSRSRSRSPVKAIEPDVMGEIRSIISKTISEEHKRPTRLAQPKVVEVIEEVKEVVQAKSCDPDEVSVCPAPNKVDGPQDSACDAVESSAVEAVPVEAEPTENSVGEALGMLVDADEVKEQSCSNVEVLEDPDVSEVAKATLDEMQLEKNDSEEHIQDDKYDIEEAKVASSTSDGEKTQSLADLPATPQKEDPRSSSEPKETSEPNSGRIEHSESSPSSHKKNQRDRSRSPRRNSPEIIGEDGTKFVLAFENKKDHRASRYLCPVCSMELQKKSIESHVTTRGHRSNLNE
mmetsp:Transcript_18499/g.33383  ORF Transcript_18499/g.33383 Transcript_18499/m.33383 type:complete len:383 (-) Transcript_18499:728-1876(-)